MARHRVFFVQQTSTHVATCDQRWPIRWSFLLHVARPSATVPSLPQRHESETACRRESLWSQTSFESHFENRTFYSRSFIRNTFSAVFILCHSLYGGLVVLWRYVRHFNHIRCVCLIAGERRWVGARWHHVWHVGGARCHVLHGVNTQSRRHRRRQVILFPPLSLPPLSVSLHHFYLVTQPDYPNSCMYGTPCRIFWGEIKCRSSRHSAFLNTVN